MLNKDENIQKEEFLNEKSSIKLNKINNILDSILKEKNKL